MLKRLVAQTAGFLADPRRRMMLRALLLILALVGGWLVPHHSALAAEAYLIPGGQGT